MAAYSPGLISSANRVRALPADQRLGQAMGSGVAFGLTLREGLAVADSEGVTGPPHYRRAGSGGQRARTGDAARDQTIAPSHSPACCK